jgi:hypothetical protein
MRLEDEAWFSFTSCFGAGSGTMFQTSPEIKGSNGQRLE